MKPSEKELREIQSFAQSLVLQKPNLSIVTEGQEHPWFLQEFQRLLKADYDRNELILPNLMDNNESLAVFTDFGGDSPDSNYLTYTFLVCAWNQTDLFKDNMTKIRETYGLDNPFKEIAFKHFRYGPIQRALNDYLLSLNNLVNGLLLTVVIDKSIGSMFGVPAHSARKLAAKTLEDSGFGIWKPKVAEKIYIVVGFASYLVSLLSRQGQKVFWMTDHDAIAPSKEKFQNVLSLFNHHLNVFSKHGFGIIGGATPFKKKTVLTMDLLSSADVVAGSIEQYYTRKSKNNGDKFKKPSPADNVLGWLSEQGIALKKRSIIYYKKEDQVVSGNITISSIDNNPDLAFVPVFVNREKNAI